MKPYLPLTLVTAMCLASASFAHTGSSKLSPESAYGSSTANPQSASESTTQSSSSTGGQAVDNSGATEGDNPAVVSPSPTPETPLQITDAERQYFDFGYSLSKAAFSYADVAKQSLVIQKSSDRMEQIKLLAALAPAADRDRAIVRENLDRALIDMRDLHATRTAMSIVRDAAESVDRPLEITGAAKELTALSPAAGNTLASLNEFERISGLTESPDIAAWLKGKHKNRTGNVWYAEGLISGVAEVASAQDMPELLPTVGEVATDLRGLRDWLLLRMPDPPTADQAQLNLQLDQFLRLTSAVRRQDRPLTHEELVALGSISRELQSQVLPQTAAQPSTAGAQVAVVKKSL